MRYWNDNRDLAQTLLERVAAPLAKCSVTWSTAIEIDLRALCGLATTRGLNALFMRRAVCETVREGTPPSLDALEAHLAALTAQATAEAEDRSQQFTLYAALEVALLDAPAAPLTALGKQFELITRDALHEQLRRRRVRLPDRTDVAARHAVQEATRRPQFLVCHVAARDVEYALHHIGRALRLVLDILEFVAQMSRVQIAIGPSFHISRSQIGALRQMLVVDGANRAQALRVDFGIGIDDHAGSTQALATPTPAPITWAFVGLLLNRFADPLAEDSTQGVLQAALRQFADAMVRAVPHQALLGLWRTVECLGLAGKGSRRVGVSQRIAALVALRDKDEHRATEFALECCRRLRNEFAHEGPAFHLYDTDAEILKSICIDAIMNLAKHLDALPDETALLSFYEGSLQINSAPDESCGWRRPV